MTLPTTKQSRREIDPRLARIFLAGMPKGGKTTLLSEWAPDTTLIVDTHNGTQFLPGEHYVAHVAGWEEFVGVVDALVAGRHEYMTIGLDLVDDIWKFADAYVARNKGVAAAGLIDYGKGTAEAEGLFRREVGRLIASGYGLWFIGHTTDEEVPKTAVRRFVPELNKRVRTFIEGVCSYILLLETLGPVRQLRTQPSAGFQAGSRTPLPEPMPLDARLLYKSILAGVRGELDAPSASTRRPAAPPSAVPAA